MRVVFLVGNNREMCLYKCFAAGIKIDHVIAYKGQEEILDSWKVACKLLDVPISIIKKSELNALINKLDPNLVVSIGFPLLISKEIINSGRLFINVHPTLLPKYRGAHSGFYILANNEKQSGVTIHYLTENMDMGDIIAQEKFELTVFDTPISMYKKSRDIEARMLVRIIEDFVKGKNLIGRKQNENEATTYVKLRNPEDSKIDPTRSILELFHVIRACDPNKYPAFFEYEGQKICIKMWRPEKPLGEEDLL
jgi:methionyl-tRNA formyltransferase